MDKKGLSKEEKEKMANEDYSDVEAAANEYAKTVMKPQEEAKLQEAEEDFNEIIESEQDFLKFVDDISDDKIEVIFRGKLLKFRIRGVEEGDDLSFLQADASNFIDMPLEERKLMRKYMKGMRLTEKEHELIDEIQARNRRDAAKNSMIAVSKLLEEYVVEPKLSKEAWAKFPLNLKLVISNEIMEKLGLGFGETITLFHGD